MGEEGHGPSGRQADAVIVGGGIIGCATAWWLARAGMDVRLFEKGRIGGEQSGRNWGWIRRIGRHGAELPLAVRALSLWPRLSGLLGAETGFAACGLAYLCKTREEAQARAAWLAGHGAQAGEDIRMLSARQVRALFPQAQARFHGALFAAGDGRAEPLAATRAFAGAAVRSGARIVEGCAVREVLSGGGAVRGVVSERGEVRAPVVIIAGGVWSRLLCERLGLRLPQLGVLNSVMHAAPVAGAPEVVAGGGEYAFRRKAGGGHVIAHWRLSETLPSLQHLRFARDFLPALRENWRSLPPRLTWPFPPWAAPARWREGEETPFERARVLDPVPSRRILKRALAALKRDFPVFEGVRIERRQAGVIDVLPDVLPVIDAASSPRGLILATGFSGHGFGIGPAAAEAAAALALGREAAVDLSAFALARLGRSRA